MHTQRTSRWKVGVAAVAALFAAACGDTDKPTAASPASEARISADFSNINNINNPTAEMVNMTVINRKEVVDGGACFIAAPTGSATGTGLYKPFMRVNVNRTWFQAWNTSTRPILARNDAESNANWTTDIRLSEIPYITNEFGPECNGGPYREVRMDINQANPLDIALNQIRVYVHQGPNGGARPDGVPGAQLVFNLDAVSDKTIRASKLVSGSGRDDLILLIPERFFPTAAVAACPYDQGIGTSCNWYFSFFNEAGSAITAPQGYGGPTNPHNPAVVQSSGFEEWGVLLRPIPGSITVAKACVGGSEGTFQYSMTPGEPATFSRTCGQSAEVIRTSTFGTYNITEAVPSGWDLTSLSCTGGGTNTTVNIATGTATVGLDAGENVVCTYTNTKRATIVIRKISEGGVGTFNYTASGSGLSNFGLTTATAGVAVQQTIDNLTAGGDRSITETVPEGWRLKSLECSAGGTADLVNATATINNLSAGATVTCTFTNEKLATLRIAKVTVPAGDAQAFTFTPTGGWNGDETFTRAHGQTALSSGFLVPGTYGATETVPTGWALTARACVLTGTTTAKTFTSTTNGVSVALAAGEDVTCTFTNTKQAKLRIAKVTVPAGDATNFTFTPTGGWNGGSSFTRSGTQAAFESAFLTPGTYGATETVPTGWSLTGRACVLTGTTTPKTFTTVAFGVDVALGAGEDVTCTFTNEKLAKLRIAKVTVPAGDNTDFTFTPIGSWNGGSTFTRNGTQGAFESAFLAAGTYGATETLRTGWDLTGRACVLTGTTTAKTFTQPSNGVSVTLAAGEDVTCTFTNTKRATIVVRKVSEGGVGTFSYTGSGAGLGTFDLTTTTADVAVEETFANLVPGGNRSITETVPTGWRLKSLSCTTGGSGDVNSATATINNLAAGATVTCTFTNEKLATLIVEKITVNGVGSFNYTTTGGLGSFALTTTTAEVAVQQTFANLLPGSYSVSEDLLTMPAGFLFTSLQCTGTGSADVLDATASVTLGAGQTVTCTYTNSFTPAEVRTNTAWAANGDEPGSLRYNTSGGNWATYVAYDGTAKTVNVYAGQTMLVGTATFSAAVDGKVTITMTLTAPNAFLENTVMAVQGYDQAPSGNPSPGLFQWKVSPGTSTTATVTVDAANFFGVHAVVISP